MRILHISPYYFNPASIVGGGERYAYGLAYAAAKKNPVVFLSFAKEKSSVQNGPLKEVYLTSLASLDFFKWLEWADVIHCHQLAFHHTDWAILYAKLLRHKKVFATDLGGCQPRCLSNIFPLRKALDGLLCISQYSQRLLFKEGSPYVSLKSEVVYGGVDLEKFCPEKSVARERNILYVGRIVAHKGIEHLIDAADGSISLEIIGHVYEPEYYDYLCQKAVGKKVRFLDRISDQELVGKYRTAAAVVQPSVYKNYKNHEIIFPELLGLASLEAMACGAPVIVSDVASLPELIQDGENGFIVPPNSPAAIREKIDWILSHPQEAAAMGRKGHAAVSARFTWEQTAERCFRAYSGNWQEFKS